MSFKRPAHVTTISPLRSSDRRKLVAAVAEQYSLEADTAKQLVPDGLQSAKFHTHLDTPGVVYFSANPSTANPLWFSLLTSKQSSGAIPLLHPTIYTLLAHPGLIATVTTHPHVISRLISGSDLMLPGLAGPPTSPDLRVGDMIGVKATGSDEILGVGRCAVASADMKRSRKGKAVEMIHCWKDCLWDIGKEQKVISFSLPKEGEYSEFLSSSDEEESDEVEAVGDKVEKASLGAKPASSAAPNASPAPAAEVQSLSPQDVETVLRLALLQYLTTLLPAPPPGLLPIPSSTFYERHILPFRPSWAPAQAAVIQKTGYKKVGKWLKAMEKEGLLKLKSSKDQDTVIAVDLKHAAVQGHKPHVTIAESVIKDKKKAAREAAANGDPAPESAGDDGAGTTAKKARITAVREVYKPSGLTLPFWAARNVSPDAMLTAQEVRTHLQAYVTANTVVPRDQSVVFLDDVLKRALLNKNEDGVVRLKKPEVEMRLRNKMTELFAVDRVGEEGVLKKGSPAPIHIAGKKRASKHVMLVTGLETFSIDPKSFADDLKRLCASSTGVSPLTSASPKAMLSEVLVQGSHDKIVADLLVSEHGIPRKWIVFDKGR